MENPEKVKSQQSYYKIGGIAFWKQIIHET